ncbi:hypothetical protein, partial [Salmonella sp. s57610]
SLSLPTYCKSLPKRPASILHPISIFAKLNNNNNNNKNYSPPTLIRNQPVFAAPEPFITPSLREDMGSYEEAIAGLKKVLSDKGELGPVAASKIEQITAELQTTDSKPVADSHSERIKTGFIKFKTEKFETNPAL